MRGRWLGAPSAIGINLDAGRAQPAASNCTSGLFDLDASPASPQPCCELSTYGLSVIADSAFPYYSDPPTGIDQGSDNRLVPDSIALQLLVPELGSGFWKTEETAAHMAMPEAAMHEDNSLPFRQHQIWFAWKVLGVQSISEASAPELCSHLQFRAGVLAPDT